MVPTLIITIMHVAVKICNRDPTLFLPPFLCQTVVFALAHPTVSHRGPDKVTPQIQMHVCGAVILFHAALFSGSLIISLIYKVKHNCFDFSTSTFRINKMYNRRKC